MPAAEIGVEKGHWLVSGLGLVFVRSGIHHHPALAFHDEHLMRREQALSVIWSQC